MNAPIEPASLLERADAYIAEHGMTFPRELADALGTTEAALVAAECDGERVVRLNDDFESLVPELKSLGQVKTVTRNADAVIEKNGVFEPVEIFKHGPNFIMGNVLDAGVDLRLFIHAWGSAFAVHRPSRKYAHSFYFFDKEGTAIHKIFIRSKAGAAAWDELVAKYRAADQPNTIETRPKRDKPSHRDGVDAAAFIDDWAQMTDTHQFFGILRRHDVPRLQAMQLAEGEFTRTVPTDAHEKLLAMIAEAEQTVMIFVGNPGLYQIHVGPVKNIKPMNDWFNIFDPGFELHMKKGCVAHAFVVRKPTAAGDLHSLELYDDKGNEIALFHMKRKDGDPEAQWWREMLRAL